MGRGSSLTPRPVIAISRNKGRASVCDRSHSWKRGCRRYSWSLRRSDRRGSRGSSCATSQIKGPWTAKISEPRQLHRLSPHVRCGSMLSKKSKIEQPRKSRESRILDAATAAKPSTADRKTGGRFCMKRCGPSGRCAPNASAVFKIFLLHPKKTFSTASVKLRRTRYEHMFSALLSNSDIARCSRHVSNVPIGDIPMLFNRLSSLRDDQDR